MSYELELLYMPSTQLLQQYPVPKLLQTEQLSLPVKGNRTMEVLEQLETFLF